MATQHMANSQKPFDGSRPERRIGTPIKTTAPMIDVALFWKPPHLPSSRPPASIPIEKAISAMDAWTVVPPKQSSDMSGNRALMGEYKIINSAAVHIRAYRPRCFRITASPSHISLNREGFPATTCSTLWFGIWISATARLAANAPNTSSATIWLMVQIGYKIPAMAVPAM